MRFRRSMRLMGFACVLQMGLAAPAEASGISMINAQLLAAIQTIGAQPHCFTYTYDRNGNRLSQSSVNYSATATWGSSVYGCSIWTFS